MAGHNMAPGSPSLEVSTRRMLADSGTMIREDHKQRRYIVMPETSTQSGGRPSLPMQGVPQPKRDEVLNLPRVHLSQHPVMADKMTALRDKNTQPPEFYHLVKEIGALLAYEATATLAVQTSEIETPMGPMTGQRLAGGIGVVPVLRA